MTTEEAEAIVSDPSGYTIEEVTAATAMVDLPTPPDNRPAPSLSFLLAVMESKAESAHDKAIYNELSVIVGESKMRLAQVAKKVENDSDHVAHAILSYLTDL